MDRACCAVSITGIQKLVSYSQLAFFFLRWRSLKFLLYVEFLGLSIVMFVVLPRYSLAELVERIFIFSTRLINGESSMSCFQNWMNFCYWAIGCCVINLIVILENSLSICLYNKLRMKQNPKLSNCSVKAVSPTSPSIDEDACAEYLFMMM